MSPLRKVRFQRMDDESEKRRSLNDRLYYISWFSALCRCIHYQTSYVQDQPHQYTAHMFSSTEMGMNKRQLSACTDPASWFNRFYDIFFWNVNYRELALTSRYLQGVS